MKSLLHRFFFPERLIYLSSKVFFLKSIIQVKWQKKSMKNRFHN